MSLRRNGIKTVPIPAEELLRELAHKCNDMKVGSSALLITENDNRVDVIFQGPHKEYRFTVFGPSYINPTEECCRQIINMMLFNAVVNTPSTAVNSEGKTLS